MEEKLSRQVQTFSRLFRGAAGNEDPLWSTGDPSGHLVDSGLRSIAWKVSLGLLPARCTDEWTALTIARRRSYVLLKAARLTDPRASGHDMDPTLNNPLCPVENSPWANWSEMVEVRSIVQLDVGRLFPDNDFFAKPHVRALITDVLTLWSLENAAVSYRQGMHELLAPLVFALMIEQCEPESEQTCHAAPREDVGILCTQLAAAYVEHDAYALFSKLMERAADCYAGVEELTGSAAQQHVVCQVYDPLLKRADPALYAHLKALEVQPQLFGLRWGPTFTSFRMLPSRCDLHFLSFAMLMFVRQQLLGADYIGCLSRLQHFPQMDDVTLLIDVARRLKGDKQPSASVSRKIPPDRTAAALRSARERRVRDAEERVAAAAAAAFAAAAVGSSSGHGTDGSDVDGSAADISRGPHGEVAKSTAMAMVQQEQPNESSDTQQQQQQQQQLRDAEARAVAAEAELRVVIEKLHASTARVQQIQTTALARELELQARIAALEEQAGMLELDPVRESDGL